MAALSSFLRILLLYFWACSIIAAGIINDEEKKLQFTGALLKTNSSVDVDGVHHVDLGLNPDFNVTAAAIDHGMGQLYSHFSSRFGIPGQHSIGDIDDSRPFIFCEKFNDTECRENGGQNCRKMERCFLDGNKRSYGCMSVFEHNSTDYGNATKVHFAADPMRIKLKGCLPHSYNLFECFEEECLAELPSEPGVPGSDRPLFCCCKTHMCNKATFIAGGEVYKTAVLKKRMRIKGIPVTEENLQKERRVFDAEKISTTEAPNTEAPNTEAPIWQFQDHTYVVSIVLIIVVVVALVVGCVLWRCRKGDVKNSNARAGPDVVEHTLPRNSGAVSEEDHHDNGSQKAVQSAPSPAIHPRAAGDSLPGSSRAMTEYSNPEHAGEKEPLMTQTTAL